MIEYYVSQAECRVVGRQEEACLTTVLGSCVAACLWDARAGVGGMNHFLLPRANGGGRLAVLSAGNMAMATLLANCIAAGADRRRLQARLFGGARVVALLSDIGARNIICAREFLRAEGIALASEEVGGALARRIRFWPATGIVRHHVIARVVA